MNPLNILAKFEVRSFICSWDNREYFKNFGSTWIRQCPLFSQIFKGLLFAWRLWIYLPNLNFVALRVPEIIGGYWKNLGRPWILPRSLFSQIFKTLLLGWTLWIYLPNFKFVALRIREIIGGIFLKMGSPWIRPRSFFSQMFKRLLFACTLWIYLPNLNFVALCIPEIIGGTVKIWEVPGYARAPFSRKFLTAFCSHGRCEYTCQIWSLQLYAFLR